MEKTLYRARSGRIIAGVCAGMAKYMNLDPTIVRLIIVAMSLFFGGGVLLYIVSIFIIPEEPIQIDDQDDYVTVDGDGV